jgi:hypothetical protein
MEHGHDHVGYFLQCEQKEPQRPEAEILIPEQFYPPYHGFSSLPDEPFVSGVVLNAHKPLHGHVEIVLLPISL